MARLIYRRDSVHRFAGLGQCVAIVVAIAVTVGCGDKSGTPKEGNVSSAAADAAAPPNNKQGGAAANAVVETPPSANKSQRATDGGDIPTPNDKIAVEAPTAGEAPQKLTSSAAKAEAVNNFVPDDVVRKPATVEEARRVLDLTKFPLPEGAQVVHKTIAHIQYRVLGDLKPVFDFPRRELEKQGWTWKVSAQTHIHEPSGTGFGTLARDGFHVTVSLFKHATEQEPNGRGISITNCGNVNLSKLPVPPGAKLTHSYPTNIYYVAEKSLAETTTAVHELLTGHGWEPYEGPNGASYKQNAILLYAKVHSADGKTNLSYDVRQMSADLPAPPKPLRVIYKEYTGTPKELFFETAASSDELYRFYRDKLGLAGWKATTENPISDDSKAFMVFRNPAKEMLTLETRQYSELHGTLRHQSAEELAEIERLIELDRPRREKELAELREKEAEEKRKKEELAEKKRQEEARRAVKVAIAVPADAKEVKTKADQIDFQVARGKARAAADAIRKRIRDAGWKEKKIVEEPVTGSYTFENKEFNDQRISLTYVDPGVFPAQVTVTGSGVEFEKAAAAKK